MTAKDRLEERKEIEDDGFLRRWSQRKSLAKSGELVEPEENLPEPDAPDAQAIVTQEVVEEEPELTDADMPPIESLDENSDYSAFMSPKVSEGLRRLALRKLFHLPKFNIRDGLNDYDEDYTFFEPLGDVVTSDMRMQRERAEARKRAELEAQEAEELVEEELPEDAEEVAETDTSEVEDATEDDDETGESDGPEQDKTAKQNV
ncbi:MAG: DUF3306 domain-containing protein [Gammaproteobacteria bacterium]